MKKSKTIIILCFVNYYVVVRLVFLTPGAKKYVLLILDGFGNIFRKKLRF